LPRHPQVQEHFAQAGTRQCVINVAFNRSGRWESCGGRGGLAPSDVEDVRWFKKAAEQADAAGENNLGTSYRFGRGGLSKSDAEALKWFKGSARRLHACTGLPHITRG
jgi:TPR repeat protein